MSGQPVWPVSSSTSQVRGELRGCSRWDCMANRQLWARGKIQKHNPAHSSSKDAGWMPVMMKHTVVCAAMPVECLLLPWTSTACYVAGFPSHPETHLYPCSVISLLLGFAVLLSAVPWFAGARPQSHILGIPALFSWMWGLTPSSQKPLCTPLQSGRATASHPLGWAQIYHCTPLLPSMDLLSLLLWLLFSLSVLGEVVLGYRPPLFIKKQNKKCCKVLEWWSPAFDTAMSSAEVRGLQISSNARSCTNQPCCPVTHFKHTITDSWQQSHYGLLFFWGTAEQRITTYLQVKSSSINSAKLNHSMSGVPWAVLKPCAWLTD